MADGVSIILCCHNSADRLPETLKNLAAQQVSPQISWEIIVVDNNSTDDTYGQAQQIWQLYNLPKVEFTVLREPKAGKYHAVTTGVQQARYEYIVICDDDNWLNDDYISQAYLSIKTTEGFAAVGGQGIAVADGEIPDWFWQNQRGYAVGKQNAISGDVTANGYLWGAGMVFRRSIYLKVNNSMPALLAGPDGSGVGRGEDVELCMRFILAGYRLYYDDKLVFKHYMHSNRLTDAYRLQYLNLSPAEERVLNLYRRQIQINELSGTAKLFLFFSSLLRYLASKTFPRASKWHYLYEAEIIYLLSGNKLSPLPSEVLKMRQLNRDLSQ